MGDEGMTNAIHEKEEMHHKVHIDKIGKVGNEEMGMQFMKKKKKCNMRPILKKWVK